MTTRSAPSARDPIGQRTSMRALKALTVLAVVATLGWCGYWFVGARALDRAVTAGLAHVPELTAGGHTLRGFPNRFDLTVTEPRLTTAEGAWSAPFVQLFALSYRLNHLVAVFPHTQQVTLGGQPMVLASDDLRASLVAAPSLDLPLERVAMVGREIDLQVAGETHGADGLRLGLRWIGGAVYEAALVGENVFPDAALLERLDPAQAWPRFFTELRLDAEVEFDRPLDRHVFDGPEPQPVRLTLTGAHLGWEDGSLTLAGRLTPDAAGRLSGDAMLSVTGWPALMDRARTAGLLSDENRGRIAPLLAALAAQQEGDRLEVPLAVVDGDVRLGPLLLLTLPPFPARS